MQINMFRKDSTIESRVLAVIRERIAIAQEEYDNAAFIIDKSCNCKIADIEATRISDKSNMAEVLVNKILG